MHGLGIFTSKDGSVYQGSFKDDHMDGYGEFDTQDRNFKGHYKNGAKEGKGILTIKGGHMYIGEFKNDKFHGFGTY